MIVLGQISHEFKGRHEKTNHEPGQQFVGPLGWTQRFWHLRKILDHISFQHHLRLQEWRWLASTCRRSSFKNDALLKEEEQHKLTPWRRIVFSKCNAKSWCRHKLALVWPRRCQTTLMTIDKLLLQSRHKCTKSDSAVATSPSNEASDVNAKALDLISTLLSMARWRGHLMTVCSEVFVTMKKRAF